MNPRGMFHKITGRISTTSGKKCLYGESGRSSDAEQGLKKDWRVGMGTRVIFEELVLFRCVKIGLPKENSVVAATGREKFPTGGKAHDFDRTFLMTVQSVN